MEAKGKGQGLLFPVLTGINQLNLLHYIHLDKTALSKMVNGIIFSSPRNGILRSIQTFEVI